MRFEQPFSFSNQSHVARWMVMLIVVLALVVARQMISAQPVTHEVLDYAEITHRDADSTTVAIHFRFPVAYQTHFPAKSGEVLMIKIRPTVLGNAERDPSRRREALRPPAGTNLTDIVYDEESLWSPYLILHFSESVSFAARQGRDGRSIVVEFSHPESTPAPGSSPSISAE